LERALARARRVALRAREARRSCEQAVDPLVAIITLALLAAVILLISAPLRSRRAPHDSDGERAAASQSRASLELQELEAAREAKYREIRDAELDYRTGKLSQQDYEAIDRALRAEALEILERLDRVRA
jgi:hypothetical protein